MEICEIKLISKSRTQKLVVSDPSPPAQEVVREKEANKEEGRGSTTGGAGNITLTSSQFKEFLDSVMSARGTVPVGEVVRGVRNRDKEVDRIVKNIAPFSEGGNLVNYISGLETQLREREIEEERWKCWLISYLRRSQTRRQLPSGRVRITTILKKIVLTQYGRSLRTIGAQMFPKRRAHIRDRRELAQFVHDEVTRVSMLCTTAE